MDLPQQPKTRVTGESSLWVSSGKFCRGDFHSSIPYYSAGARKLSELSAPSRENPGQI